MAMFRKAFLFLFFTVVAQGFPAVHSGLPSMLSITSEEELGHYSKKWNISPVQMCTLMGHQMTIAQPLLDIHHPLVSHLPSISEMAMSDAVMICEKVLRDAKGGLMATIVEVVEETREEYTVPRDLVFDDIFEELTEDILDAVSFSDDEMREAIEDNEGMLNWLLQEDNYEDSIEAEEVPPPPTTPQTPTLAETEEVPPPTTTPATPTIAETEEVPPPPTTPPPPLLAKTLGRIHAI